MLVLGRNWDESIILLTAAGERIRIVCLEPREGFEKCPDVRIGIDAPDSVIIERAELLRRPGASRIVESTKGVEHQEGAA